MMRCEMCGRLIEKPGDYRRMEMQAHDRRPLYNLPLCVSCMERMVRRIYEEGAKRGQRADTRHGQ